MWWCAHDSFYFIVSYYEAMSNVQICMSTYFLSIATVIYITIIASPCPCQHFSHLRFIHNSPQRWWHMNEVSRTIDKDFNAMKRRFLKQENWTMKMFKAYHRTLNEQVQNIINTYSGIFKTFDGIPRFQQWKERICETSIEIVLCLFDYMCIIVGLFNYTLFSPMKKNTTLWDTTSIARPDWKLDASMYW